jgi:hypothetical protein
LPTESQITQELLLRVRDLERFPATGMACAGFDGDESADLSTGGGGDVTVGVGSTDICVGTDTDGPLGPVQVVYEDSVQVESRLRADGLVETAVG